ncbi:MAG: DUF4160 domain-containing protein [Bdellovibrionales bacterium]|nr:DUF4160 domain-containing protein [Bdellovibrionales bacterium]MCB0412685.1 DUF4160 domain-containing protein [Bdellovibrionales bacterium]
MGKIRRGGFIITWHLGDHLPIHVHVYKNQKLVCRWMLYEGKELSGKASKKLIKIIEDLKDEGIFEELEKLK